MSVFPVDMRPGDTCKGPLRGYRWKQRATSEARDVEEDVIDAIEALGEGNVGIAWALGLNAKFALDLDGPEPPWWGELADTGTNPTRRGVHRIYAMPVDRLIGNGTAGFPTEGWGEARGAGGYIVVWGPDRPGFDVAELSRIAQFNRPDWLRDANDETVPCSPVELAAFRAMHTDGDAAKVKGFVTKLAARPPGSSRNKWATDVACWIARESAAGLVPAAVAFDVLEKWWASVSAPEPDENGELKTRKLTKREIVRIECWAIGTLTPERIDETRAKAEREQAEYRRAQREDQERMFGGGSMNTPHPPPAEDDDELLLELIDWSVVHDPADDLVERYIIPGRWTQNVIGAKGGKSSWTMWVAVELSEGRDPVDGTAVDPVSVLYCDGEMGRADLEALIRDIGHDPLALAHLHCSDARPRLDSAEGAARLLRRVDRLGARLVVLDGLNGFIAPGADENTSDVWRAVFEYTIARLKGRGVAIVSNDNLGKDPAKGARGSSAKSDKADGVVLVQKTDQGLRLTTTHSRAGAYFDTLVLNAEGFDRSKPIRYWRGVGGWPAGTEAAVKVLDRLDVPLDWGSVKVRAAVRAAGESMSNEVIAAAIRFRKQNPIRTP